MMLPNATRAVIDRRKLVDYCLNPDHPRGKNKARVFRAALDVGIQEASELDSKIRESILETDCQESGRDEFGIRYTVDFTWVRPGRKATVRTTWILKTLEDFPRLTSCYVL